MFKKIQIAQFIGKKNFKTNHRSIVKNVEQLEHSYTTVGNAKWKNLLVKAPAVSQKKKKIKHLPTI